VIAEPLHFTSATQLARMIRSREISVRETMLAFLSRIDRLNPKLNAIVGRLEELACLSAASAADRAIADGRFVGRLHGLPVAIKDLEPLAGFPWTRGSLAYRDAVATEDSAIVQRLKAAGAIPIGKTNVPEFGMGSHTYNRVHGVTRNPWNLAKTAGGSSGGAAAAVAAGLLSFADGSDFGGSLRNPANFTNIVGMRPSIGLVPDAPNPLPGVGFGVKGPLARSVEDLALVLSVLSDADFTLDLDRDVRGLRIAWAPDLGGLPVDRQVRRIVDAQRYVFEDLGCRVHDAAPEFHGVDEFFMTIRAARSWKTLGPLLDTHRDELKPEAVWEIEAGSHVTDTKLASAMERYAAFVEQMRRFHETFHYLVCVVNQVPPFDVTGDWPHDIAGVQMDHYIAWMKSAYWISATAGPAISVPAGFTGDGLPVGIQIVGARGNDAGVLRLAHAFEQATNVGRRRPPIAIN
jgi:amidase